MFMPLDPIVPLLLNLLFFLSSLHSQFGFRYRYICCFPPPAWAPRHGMPASSTKAVKRKTVNKADKHCVSSNWNLLCRLTNWILLCGSQIKSFCGELQIDSYCVGINWNPFVRTYKLIPFVWLSNKIPLWGTTNWFLLCSNQLKSFCADLQIDSYCAAFK